MYLAELTDLLFLVGVGAVIIGGVLVVVFLVEESEQGRS